MNVKSGDNDYRLQTADLHLIRRLRFLQSLGDLPDVDTGEAPS